LTAASYPGPQRCGRPGRAPPGPRRG
jgi:hypothetical protein